MVDTMLSNPNWTFRPWKQIMEEQLGSWMMYIPGMSSSQDVKEMKGMKEILDAMTPEELDNPQLINGVAKQRIAQAAGKPIDNVLMLCFLHKQSSVVAKWLHTKYVSFLFLQKLFSPSQSSPHPSILNYLFLLMIGKHQVKSCQRLM